MNEAWSFGPRANDENGGKCCASAKKAQALFRGYAIPSEWSTNRKLSRNGDVGSRSRVLGGWSATLPQSQGFGSIPIWSLTADRIRCLQPRYRSSFELRYAPRGIGS